MNRLGWTFAALLFAAPMTAAENQVIAFLEARTASDPEDVVAWNRLAGEHLRLLRTTGNHDHLEAAERCAEASLRALPAEQNRGALALLIRARAGFHRFAEAKELSLELIAIDPRSQEAWQGLGDALMELGEYKEAEKAYAKMASLGKPSVATETRRARFAVLHGRTSEARRHFERALALATTDAEARAWCHWQLGELAFADDDHEAAERHYRAALKAFPRSIATLGALARLAVARGDVAEAMVRYGEAIALDPLPAFLAALADLHAARGEQEKARELFARIEEGASNARDRRLDRRHLALIYADRDMNLETAYRYAREDYAERRDIYAADTLAWCAFKAGHLEEAERVMAEALRLGTKDERLRYHAAMIARAVEKEQRGKEQTGKEQEEAGCWNAPRQ